MRGGARFPPRFSGELKPNHRMTSFSRLLEIAGALEQAMQEKQTVSGELVRPEV